MDTPRNLSRHLSALERTATRLSRRAVDPFPIDHLEDWEVTLLSGFIQRHKKEGDALFTRMDAMDHDAAMYVVARMTTPSTPVNYRFRRKEAKRGVTR